MRASNIRFFGPAVVLAAVLASTSLAQGTSGPAAPPATTQIALRQHGPMQFHGMRTDNSTESYNWSGYAVTAAAGSSFTQVLGSWKVPTVNCKTTPNTYASFWVGLDGYNSSTVEQTGTDSDCSGGTPQYYAWYEFYPQDSYYACPQASGFSRNPPPCPLQNLKPGDVMQASVTYTTAGKNGTFTATITDVTSGATFSTSYEPTRAAARSSAEWIAEAPCCTSRGGILPLSDFGTVSFGSDYTAVKGTNNATEGAGNSIPIGSFPTSSVQEITMVGDTSSNPTEATPSILTADESSFTVVWDSE